MTPTFSGRVQTRLLLFLLIGIPVSILFAYLWGDSGFDQGVLLLLLTLLVTITIIGLVLDVVYIGLQRLRWDRDWPFAYQFFFSWVEFGIAAWAAEGGLVPFFPETLSADLWTMMITHFAVIFVLSFLALLGPLQVLSLRWRYNGGQFGRM